MKNDYTFPVTLDGGWYHPSKKIEVTINLSDEEIELLKKIVRENKDEWQYGLSQLTQREAPEIYEKLFDAVYPELFLLNLVYGFKDNGFGEDPYDDEDPEDWTVDDVDRLEDLYGDWMELGSESFIVPIPDFLKD